MTIETKSATDYDRAIGLNIKRIRMMRGLSQGKIAEAIGVTWQQHQKYEAGVNRIAAGKIPIIANILGCSVSDLVPDAGGASASPPYVSEFLSTAEGLSLTRAFTRIRDTGIRRRIVELVEALGTQTVADRLTAPAQAAE